MVHREGGKGKNMEIFGPLCTAILSFSPSGAVITELTFITDSDKTAFPGSCDKMVHHSCPLPTEQSKLKLNLSHGLAHFCLPTEVLNYRSSSLHLRHNLPYFYLEWQGEISAPQVVLGWQEVCRPPLPVTGIGWQLVTAACGTQPVGVVHSFGQR